MQLLFLQRQPVLCASALEAESTDWEAAAGGGAATAAAMVGYIRPPYDAASAAALDADACIVPEEPPRPSDAPSEAPDSSVNFRYLVSNAWGFRAKTSRWASLRIFSHRGTLQHSRHRHCVPQYNLAPKHWQYNLRHRVRLQVHPMLWTSSRRVEWSWLGDVAASRSSSRFLPRRLLAEDDDAATAAAAAEDRGVRLTAYETVPVPAADVAVVDPAPCCCCCCDAAAALADAALLLVACGCGGGYGSMCP